MSGVPEENLAKSILKIRSKVLIRAVSEREHQLQVFFVCLF